MAIQGRRQPTEIGNLQTAVDAEKQIFWHNVAMDDLLRVTVAERVRQLIYVLERKSNAYNNDTHEAETILEREREREKITVAACSSLNLPTDLRRV